MARHYIRLCYSCAEKLKELYDLKETVSNTEQKRARCELCKVGGCFIIYNYDPHAPKRRANAERN